MTKAVMMISTITFMSFLIVTEFECSFFNLYEEVATHHKHSAAVLGPGVYLQDAFSTFSLAVALTLGFAGLPHILMRIVTVPDARQANISLIYATACIGLPLLMIFFVIGFGAIVLLAGHPEFYNEAGKLIGGNNMISIHLSKVLGGDVLFGVVSVVAFATILAVVAGLILSGASAVSNDLYANDLLKGKISEAKEVKMTRIAAVFLGIIGIFLALAFEDQNIVYMAALVLGVAASSNFPVLILSMYWRGLITRGAIVGGSTGLLLSVGLIIVGPTIWVEILGNSEAIFPFNIRR
jgi:cation/acetate symporter